MAEGPLVHYYAKRLQKTLQGKEVHVEFGIRALKPFEPLLRGLSVTGVEAYGKQFRIHFSDNHVLLVHLMMWGSWKIFGKDEPWDKPRHRARVIFRTSTHDVVVFSAPIVRLLTQSELESDPTWGHQGPDPLRPDFSRVRFFDLLKSQNSRPIGEALLDQRVIAGIGNILRIEILFGSHIHPQREVKTLSAQEREELLRWVLKLTQTWLKEMGKRKSWIQIYRKSGQPCPRCGELIEFFRQGGRITYACRHCQT